MAGLIDDNTTFKVLQLFSKIETQDIMVIQYYFADQYNSLSL